VTYTFLYHQWKYFWRSRGTGKSLAMQLLVGFFTVYLLFSVLGIGYFLQKIIAQFFPGQEPTAVFSGFLLYYFAIDLVVRFQFQSLPTIAIQPYLTQNIKRKKIIEFLNIRSLFSVLNLIPFFLLVPFTVIAILPKYHWGATFSFIGVIMLITTFNHFFALYIKRKTIISTNWYIGFLVLITIFFLCDYFHVFSISTLSAKLFGAVLTQPWLIVLALLPAAFSFWNNNKFLQRSLYLEDMVDQHSQKEDIKEYSFFDRYGIVGELINLDIRLVLRHKRPRALLISSAIYLLLGVVVYHSKYFDQQEQWGNAFLLTLLIIGVFSIQYGQYLFAWQSTSFDGLLAGTLNVKTYIKSKFIFLIIISTIAFLLSTFYGLINWRIIIIELAAYLYIIGIQPIISVFFATRSYHAIDLSKGSAFSLQGTGLAQLVAASMVVLVPWFIYMLVYYFSNVWLALGTLGLLGLTSLLLQNVWIKWLVKEFNNKKYFILEGFREK
jgi:hypothetical protein